MPTAPKPEHEIHDPVLARQRLRLWLQMLRSVRHMENELRERLRVNFDTTLPRFDVLALLLRKPDGLKMSELSRQLMVSNGNVTGIVERLAAEGLIERQSVASDRRAALARITAKGREVMAGMTATHLVWIDELMGTLSEPELSRAIAAMVQLRGDPMPAPVRAADHEQAGQRSPG